MKTITINSNDAGQRLDRFLSKRFRTMPKSLIYKYIRTKYIKLNSKRCKPEDMLTEGDILTLYIRDEFFEQKYDEYEFMKAPDRLSVVFEDDNLLLIDKPEGLLVHPDREYHFDSLLNRVQHYLYSKGEYDPKSENSFAPALVNRIDRNTSGLVVAAKNAPALKALSKAFRNRQVHKYYLCLAEGRLKADSGEFNSLLKKDEAKNKVSVTHDPDGAKQAITKYTVLDRNARYTLAEVMLVTGRTHQIRAHFAAAGHPLAGDKKYGGHPLAKQSGIGQTLYSYKLCFDSELDKCIGYLSGRVFRVNSIWFEKDGKINL